MTRECFLPCQGNNCGDPLRVEIQQVAPTGDWNGVQFRVTHHPNSCKSCGWRDDMQPFPEYPQGELAAAFALGEELI